MTVLRIGTNEKGCWSQASELAYQHGVFLLDGRKKRLKNAGLSVYREDI